MFDGYTSQVAWCADVLLVREIFKLNVPEARALLRKYGNAEAVVEHHNPEGN